MGGHYVIAGKTIPNHLLAMGFISAYAVAGIGFSMKPKAAKPDSPPIIASSSEEEAFIREFLTKADAEDKQ